MIDVTEGQAYENLANAIIVQAIKDYKAGYRREEVMRFFNSDWYSTLTSFPRERIIEICERGVSPTRMK